MTAIMRQLLDFARRGSSRRDPVDLRKLAASVFELLGSNADRQGVTLELAADGSAPPVTGDAAQLQQVLMNLVINGLHAMPDGGVLTVRLDRSETATPPGGKEQPGPWALLEVRDSGVGIPAENLLDKIHYPACSRKATISLVLVPGPNTARIPLSFR